MRQMTGSLMNSKNSLNITQDKFNRATILGVSIQISEGDTRKIKENYYELTPEVYKALSDPLYTGNTMNNDNDFLMLYNILKDVIYTGNGDRPPNRKISLQQTSPKKLVKFIT